MCIGFLELVQICIYNPWIFPTDPGQAFVAWVNIVMQVVSSFNGVC